MQWTLESRTVWFSNNLKLEQKIWEKFGLKLEQKFESRTMSAALRSIVRLMPFNSKVEQTESRTASWNGLCLTFEGPLYSVCAIVLLQSTMCILKKTWCMGCTHFTLHIVLNEINQSRLLLLHWFRIKAQIHEFVITCVWWVFIILFHSNLLWLQ
jgi:hypothetical protein